MQKYKEINGNDYVKGSRTTINETMQSIQSMNSGTAFPTNNLFEGMKCYRTDLKKTYTLTDVENNTWVEDDTASKLATARKINITGDATGATAFDGSGDISISTTVNESKHAVNADTLKSSAATETSTVARPVWLSWEGDNTKQTVSPNLTYTCSTKTLKAANFAGHLAGNADSATNADTVDGVHAYSMFYNKGNWADDNWATIGTYQVNNQQLGDNWYQWGQVISSSTNNARFQLYASDNISADGRLHYRTGWDSRKNQWNTILDSENYNEFVPTKTGGGATGTWGINITGNAATATTADNAKKLGGYALNTESTGGHFGTIPKVGTDGVMEVGKYIDWHSQNGGSADYTSRWEAQNNGTVTVGTINGTLNGNAATATNADKLDGYHASDLLKKIAAANTVGIVAASLTENGYAKFANGLILQWGNASGYKYEKDNYSTCGPRNRWF